MKNMMKKVAMRLIKVTPKPIFHILLTVGQIGFGLFGLARSTFVKPVKFETLLVMLSLLALSTGLILFIGGIPHSINVILFGLLGLLLSGLGIGIRVFSMTFGILSLLLKK